MTESGRREQRRLYVIDTSSIIQPRRLLSEEKSAEKDRVFAKLGQLVDDGTLAFPPQVYDELKRYEDEKEDRPFEWARKFKEQAMLGVSTDDLLAAVARVVEVVENLVDYDKPSPVDDADPYVVALALHLAESGRVVTVITEDRNDRADKTSMQSACALLGLPALTIRVFLKHSGIWPR